MRYRIRGPVLSSALCHCRSCRRASGAPTVAWLTLARTDVQLTGSPVRFESSPGIVRQFCGRCGSPLTYEIVAEPTIDLTTATLDEPSAFPPTHEVWLEHRLSWQPAQPALVGCPRSSLEPSGDPE